MPEAQSLFDKIWSTHAIQRRQDGATLLHIARHLVHDGSSNAFRIGTCPYAVPIARSPRLTIMYRRRAAGCLRSTSRTAAPWWRTSRFIPVRPQRSAPRHCACRRARARLEPARNDHRLRRQPHRDTRGSGCPRLWCRASEVTHVLATQTLWQSKPKNLRVTVDGILHRAYMPRMSSPRSSPPVAPVT